MVKALYMEQANLLKHKAIIARVGFGEVNKKKYHWIQLDETIFHPKGGGQPADDGTINGIPVAYVHKEVFDINRLDQFEIFHCFDESQECNFNVGGEADLFADPSKRLLHSRLHTAGHLVSEAVSKNFPELEGFQGNHYPNDSYVRFKMLAPSIDYDKDEIKLKAELELRSWIEQDLPVSQTFLPSGIRVVKITKDWAPCGGTHLNSLKGIGQVEIADISINKKESKITVKYLTRVFG